MQPRNGSRLESPLLQISFLHKTRRNAVGRYSLEVVFFKMKRAHSSEISRLEVFPQTGVYPFKSEHFVDWKSEERNVGRDSGFRRVVSRLTSSDTTFVAHG